MENLVENVAKFFWKNMPAAPREQPAMANIALALIQTGGIQLPETKENNHADL